MATALYSQFYASKQPASTQPGLAALAGGGQSGATPILARYANFHTVASDHDSGILPAATPGAAVTVKNSANKILDVYGQPGDTINAISANSPYSIASTLVAEFFCAAAGAWDTLPLVAS
jgi:hypothetical protein